MKPSLVPLYYSSQNPHAKPTFSSTAGAAPPCWTTTVLFAAVQCAIVKPLGNGVLRNNPIKFLISLLPLVLKKSDRVITNRAWFWKEFPFACGFLGGKRVLGFILSNLTRCKEVLF
ncbi:hypothetical protein P8452_47864 [Trifolium repens]|nr:hypothetical protein P8452_47864 [Trifolium repens]